MIILILFTAFAASGQLEATEAVKEGNFRETRIDSWYIHTYSLYVQGVRGQSVFFNWALTE